MNLRNLILSLVFIMIFFGSAISQNGTDFTIGAKERVAIIDTIIVKFNELYVFPKIAKTWEIHLRNKLENKEYDDISNLSEFTNQLMKDMLSIHNDRHLAILVYNEQRDLGNDEEAFDEWWDSYVKTAKFNNYGFHKMERLPGNIGYLELNYMDRLELCEETATAAMSYLSNSKAIIIDLSKNPGGRQLIVQFLMSYFFNTSIHYETEIERLKGTTTEWWTLAEVPGKQMPNIPLYILTSFDTGSGAETMAYTLKHSKRATIIGDTTAGAAHKTHDHSFPELHITLAIPDGNHISIFTGTDWEGTGVIPHIPVSREKALDVAWSMALDSLIKMETNEDIQFKLEWVKKGIDIKVNPVILNVKTLKQYTGQYHVRKITLKKGALYYKREGRSEYEMIPLGNDLFMLDGLDYFRIQFNKSKEGNIIELVGLYDDGSSDISERDLH